MMVELSDGRKVSVQEFKFKHFKKLFSILTSALEDLSKNELKAENYLDRAVEVISAMTDLREEEIEELSAGDTLLLLNACLDRVLEDTNFLERLRELLKKISSLTSGTSQKSLSQKDTA